MIGYVLRIQIELQDTSEHEIKCYLLPFGAPQQMERHSSTNPLAVEAAEKHRWKEFPWVI